jgi:hypothetical protein
MFTTHSFGRRSDKEVREEESGAATSSERRTHGRWRTQHAGSKECRQMRAFAGGARWRVAVVVVDVAACARSRRHSRPQERRHVVKHAIMQRRQMRHQQPRPVRQFVVIDYITRFTMIRETANLASL